MCLVQVEHMMEQIRTDIEEMIGRLQEVMQSNKNRRSCYVRYVVFGLSEPETQAGLLAPNYLDSSQISFFTERQREQKVS